MVCHGQKKSIAAITFRLALTSVVQPAVHAKQIVESTLGCSREALHPNMQGALYRCCMSPDVHGNLASHHLFLLFREMPGMTFAEFLIIVCVWARISDDPCLR